MDTKCSCPVCDTFSCYSKQNHHCLDSYNKTMLSKINSPIEFNKTLPKADSKIDVIPSKEIKEVILSKEITDDTEVDDEESDKIETASVTTCEDMLSVKLKDFQIMPSSRNTICPSVAKLSAQVMNFPFNDYQTTMSQQKIESPMNIIKLSSFDIFEKIKEVYKACSCKVCECIIGKPQNNQVCNCKPCDCEDCNSKGSITISKAYRAIEVAQAEPDYQELGKGLFGSFVRHDHKLNESCKCKPCECNQCFKSVSMPCSCKRCQCIECDSHYQRQKLVVAAVKNNNQSHQECMCTPCQCPECSHRYGASTSLRHEVSTEIMRHLGCHCDTCPNDACAPEGTDACSCERGNQVVRKPIQRDTEFDIHRSLVTHQKFGINNNGTTHNLVAMFAAISKSYTSYPKTKQSCNCGQCSCVYCNLQFAQSSADAVKSSTISIGSMNHSTDLNELPQSQTSTLDRKVMSRKSCLKTSIHNDSKSDRLNYSDSYKLSTEMKATDIFSLGTDKSSSNCDDSKEGDAIYPIKKGERLTPYIFGCKINKSYIRFCKEQNDNDDDYVTPAKRARICTDEKDNIPFTKVYNKRGYIHIKYPNVQNYSNKTNFKIMSHGEFSTETPEKVEYDSHFDILTDKISISNCSSPNILNYNTSYNNTANVSFETYKFENYMNLDKDYCHEKQQIAVRNAFSNTVTNQLDNLYSRNNISYVASSCEKGSKTDTKYYTNTSVGNEIESKEELKPVKDSEKSKPDMKEQFKNILSNDENYKRVEKTLKEARDFTQQLMELLNKYEKANREFESVYDKLKCPNNTLVIKQTEKDSRHAFQIPKTELKHENIVSKDSLSVIPNKEIKTSNKRDECFAKSENIRKEENEAKKEEHGNPDPKELLQDQQPNEINNETKSHSQPNISGDFLDGKINPIQAKENLHDTSQSSKTSNNVMIEFKDDLSNVFSIDSSIVTDKIIKCESGSNPIIETSLSPMARLKYPDRNRRSRCKRYSQMYKQAVIASKRSKLFAPQIAKCSITTGISKDFFENIHEDNQLKKLITIKSIPKQEVYKPERVMNEIAETTVIENAKTDGHVAPTNVNYFETRTFIHGANAEKKSDTTKLPEVNEIQEVKYSSSKADQSEVSLGIYRKRSLEKGIKEAVNAIKQASVTWESKYGAHKAHGNAALSRLHLEVKKLLDLPLLQKCDTDLKKFRHTSATSNSKQEQSCDPLKVSYLAAHQVSDRAIIVTWLPPKVLDNVEGYEVLVNGRFVKRIRDHKCCETFLEHLPRCDKVLVTVKTLAKSQCLSSHVPSATMVYKPSSRIPIKILQL